MDKLVEKLKDQVILQMDMSRDMTDEEIEELIASAVSKEARKEMISVRQRVILETQIFNALRKLDVLQELVDNPQITEIMVNGPNHIFYEKAGMIYKFDGGFSSDDKMQDVIQQIVGRHNRVVNQASPIVDTRLSDGSRVNIVLTPISIEGSAICIRKFPEHPYSMDQLIDMGALSQEAAKFLEVLVEAKYNIFISGGTGSGKTTFLNALSQYIPDDERIITIEDSAELQLLNAENVVRLETRNPLSPPGPVLPAKRKQKVLWPTPLTSNAVTPISDREPGSRQKNICSSWLYVSWRKNPGLPSRNSGWFSPGIC